jgi:hypothetical protein
VYGFPLPDEQLRECLERLKVQKLKYIEELPFRVLYGYLERICKAAWPTQDMTIMVTWPRGMLVMALVACTKPNADFIPKEEDLKKVADVLAEEGFTDAPGWHWIRE